jgi:TatD DNase family protein
VLSIHSRRAATPVLNHLEEAPDAGIAVLHWFSGTKRELARAVSLGCWFSVGPAMLTNGRERALVAQMPPDRVLTESDGPFTQIDGRPAFPWDVDGAVRALSEVWNLELLGVQGRLDDNLGRLAHLHAGPAQ